MSKDFVTTPAARCAEPPKNNKGGPGVYDGEPGYPGRTASKNGAPEKVRERQAPFGDKDRGTTFKGVDKTVMTPATKTV